MIENSTLKIGGNSIFVFIGKQIDKFGNFLSKRGAKMVAKNKTKYVTNPTATLVNPFTLIISFTVDLNDKYQIILQGDYKQNYKELTENTNILTEDELFMIINQNQHLWFKKY